MDSELVGWSNPAERLKSALENNEFELYCQPILQLAGNERYPLAEVLVRLREEERALLPPGEFLPAFEHYRMMPHLDRWVVRHTVKRLAQGSRIPRFTVNTSVQTMEDKEFPRFVAGQLAANKVTASRLLFEIDEADTLAWPESVARFAAMMKPVGTPLVIDSFGTRTVSFAPLKAFAVQFLKSGRTHHAQGARERKRTQQAQRNTARGRASGLWRSGRMRRRAGCPHAPQSHGRRLRPGFRHP